MQAVFDIALKQPIFLLLCDLAHAWDRHFILEKVADNLRLDRTLEDTPGHFTIDSVHDNLLRHCIDSFEIL